MINRMFLLSAFMWAASGVALQPLLAQSPDSAQKLQDESLESIPIGPDATATTTQKSPQATVAPSAFDMTRVIIALAAVIALIFLLKAGARRIFPATATHRGASAVKIIGRTTIAPRQHLLILQFGKRLLLVGDSAGRLNPLCEVSDPEEVTAVLTQARDQSISISRRFDSIFGRARKDFDQVEENPAAEPFDPSTEIPADNPTVGEAQKELADLHEKVREVARQIGSA